MEARLDISVIPINAFPDALVEIDAGGTITAWNAQAEALFKWPRADAIGQNFYLAFASVNHYQLSEHIAHVLLDHPATRPDSPRIEILGRRQDSTEMPLELTFFPTRHGDSNRIGIFVRDISRRKQIEEEAERRLLTLVDQ